MLALRSSGTARVWPLGGRACLLTGCSGGGRDAAWAARMAGRNQVEQDGRNARTPGGPEACAVSLAVERDCGWPLVAGHARWPGASGGAAGMQLGGTDD